MVHYVIYITGEFPPVCLVNVSATYVNQSVRSIPMGCYMYAYPLALVKTITQVGDLHVLYI